MEQRYPGFIFALLVVSATAGPINIELFKDSKTCAKRCSDNHKFDYNVGNVYIYEYDAKSKTSIVGASEDSASIRIKATVEIEATSSCDFEMRLKEAFLVDPYQIQDVAFSPDEFGNILVQWPLRFSFQDGRIEDLCPNAEDPSWSLNIKRGILSAFQNSMTRFDLDQTIIETDITGKCETKYTVSDSEDDTITKTKDFVGCTHRQGMHWAVQSIGYDAKSNIQSLAIMKSSYTCTQRINKDKNILDESTCTEKHIFRPFSNGDNGAATVNTQTMTFVRTKRGGQARQDEIKHRSDLLFSHQFGDKSNANAEEKIMMKLQELCQISQEDVRPEQPQLFSELIKEMKKADTSTLNAIYKQIKSRQLCRENPEKIKKIFHDAIPMVGTSSSLQLIRDLIWKREVVDIEKDMWLASLPFIQNPEKEMLSAVRPLLEDKNVEGNTILMISSLVSGYCSVNPKCGEVAEVTEIMDVLERLIGKCSSKGPFEKTVYALRAIGNIGHSKSIVPRLTQCFTRREIPVQVRLAAIDAFRRIPCDAMRDDLLDLFNDISEDAELRINAYLALMKCPHKNIVMRIKEALRNEKNNQVGSFVWTHLTNLKDTSDPHLQDMRAILEDEELKKEFNKDRRKFSRNYEGSFFFDEINAGGKVDSNVIFSPKSFVPRSANLNLTIDLFGRAINFFEIGTRMEGVEHFLERYFGNNGYFKNKKDPDTSQKFPMRQFDDKYKVDIDTLKGFAYMRMFGNELGFWQFEDPNLSFFKNFDIKKWVKNEKIAFSKNMALMDTQLIVPTIMGLPLNLTVAATASIDVEATGKMNLASLKNIEIGASIKPSGAVKVVSQITVDAFATKAGLRMNSLAHSSTEAKMSFKMKNSKVIESKFELPKKRMEIMTFRSDFSIIQGDMVKEQMMIDDNRVNNFKCTGENFNKVTGLKLCTNLQFSNASMKQDAPYFPFTGPVVVQIALVNQDVPEGFIMRTHVNEATQSGFVIDTPNSKVNRKISLDINVNKPEKKIEFDSPWKKLTFNGKYIKNRSTQLLSGELILDHKNSKVDKYSALFQLDYSSVKGEVKWEPKIAIMSPTRKMLLDGTVTNYGKRVEADLRATGFYRHNMTLKLSAVRSKREYSCISTLRFGSKEYYLKTKIGMLPKGKAVIYSPEFIFIAKGRELINFESSFLYNPNSKIIINFKLDKVFSKIVAHNMRILMSNNKKKMKNTLIYSLKGPDIAIDVKGTMELKESRFTARVISDYHIGMYQDKLTISSKLLDESTKRLSLYDGDLTVDSENNQKNNFVLKGRFGKAEQHIETKLSLEVGNPKKNPEKFNFVSKLSYHFKPMEKNVNYTMSFQQESKNVDVGFKLSHAKTVNNIESDVEVKYGPDKTAGAKVQFNMKNKNNFNGFVSVRHIEKELFRFEDKLTSQNPQNYVNHLSVTIPNGDSVTLQSTLEKKSDKSFYMDNTLRLPKSREIKINSRMHIERENGSIYIEVDADRATIKCAPWNPKVTFDYHIKLHRQKFNLFKCMLTVVMSPDKQIKTMYDLRLDDEKSIQNILVTTPFKGFKKFESKYIYKRFPNSFKENFVMTLDDFYSYEEEYTVKYNKNDFLFDYSVKQKFSEGKIDIHIKSSYNRTMTTGMLNYKTEHDSLILDLNVDHVPNKVDVKANAELSFPRNGLNFDMKTVSSINQAEVSFNSNGEVKLQHPKVNLELTYFARADANRINFDTNFESPTSKHRNGKLNIDIALDDERTSLMGKFDVDYNGKRLYSLNTGYTYNDMIHNFQLAFLLPNGERITTVLNLSLSNKRTIHAEIKLPRDLNSFELDMDGSGECLKKNCDYKLRLTTNSPYFRNVFADMKHTEMGLIDLNAKFNGFERNMELNAKIEGEEWSKRMIKSDFKLNGEEKLKLEGDYMYHSLRRFSAKFLVMSKIGKQDDKFHFHVKREPVRSDKGGIEISGILKLFNKTYVASLTGKDFNEIKAKLLTPKLNYEATWTLDKLKWNDFEVNLNVLLDSDEHLLSFSNRHFNEMKFSVALASFSEFCIVYHGNINIQKKGNFKLKISYGEYFIESNSTVNMDNQFELKSSVAFKIFTQTGPNPKIHTGSGEIKLMHHMDSIFQKITGTFIYGKEKINFSSLVKNTGKINMNVRLKTTFNFSATLKAQIKPVDMYNTDLSLTFDTKWTGSKKLTYSHSDQNGKYLQIMAALGDGKDKKSDYTLFAKVFMKNEYGLNIKVTTDNMAKIYTFDGTLVMNRQMEKGKLRVEAPFQFMDGKPMEITFNRDGSTFTSSGNFKMMEYSMDVETSSKSVTAKAYINWNKEDRASNFNFEMISNDASDEEKTDKKFEVKLIHPVRTVAFSTKFVKNRNMLDIDIEFSGNVEKGQKIGFGFGKTQDAGYVKLTFPERTYKYSWQLDTDPGKLVYDSSFFWNFDNDDSKKIDMTTTMLYSNRNAIFDVILKFPFQSRGIRLKSELSWSRGDTLFKSKTEFSLNQNPRNIFTAQTELLKDDNNKYTLTMAMMHPKSNLNMLTTFRMFELNNKLTASMVMKYRNQNVNAMAYLDKNNNEISMKMRSPRHSAEFLGHYIMGDDYEISAKMVEGSGKPMEAYINLSPSRKNLKIQVDYDDNMPEKSYRIDGNLLTNQMVMVEAFRMDDDEKMTDALMNFQLEESNILHGKIVWKPYMIFELNEYLYSKMLENMAQMKSMMNNFRVTIFEEREQLTGELQIAYRQEIREIVTYMTKEFNEISAETSEMVKYVSEMYDRDYLYLNTILSYMSSVYYEFQYNLVNAVSYVEYHFRKGFTNYYRILIQKMTEAKTKINHIYQESYRKLAYDIEQAKLYTMKKLSTLNTQWEAKRDEYLRKLNELNRRTYQAVFDHRYTKVILMALNHRWDELVDFMQKKQMMKPVSDMISYLRTNMKDFNDQLNKLMKEIKNHPDSKEIISVINEFYQQLVWAYKYWEVEETVRNLDDRVKNYITITANSFREQIFSMNHMEIITFDLRRGEIEFKFPLVMPMFIVQNKASVDRFLKMMKKTVNKFNEWQLEYNFTLADLYYSMKPSPKPADWIPPFKAQASIFRDQHITTFDGTHLDFKGTCSYILTRDFVDNNFTVIANFGHISKDQKIESVLFHAGSEKLEMFHDYEIRHNDKKMDLPIKLNDISVNRIGNMMEVRCTRGFIITFNPTQGTVIVDISGWYFGKVAGLFGTYNNEQSDDMTMSDQRQTTNVDEFAFSWAMPGCRSHQNYAQSERKFDRCAEWFHNLYSPFRNCFRQVEPDSVYHACNTAHDPEPDMCTVARFYVDRCAEKGVPLDLPEECLMCKTTGGYMFMPGDEVLFSNESIKEEIKHSTDIIFVVEQRKCNQKIVADLNRIIQGLEQTLRNAGITDNRYGLVGFGGDNIRREYTITIKSEFMTSAGLIMNEVRNLDFYDGCSRTDPLKAISLATQYPFRSAVRKTIVLVTCNMFCGEKTTSYQQVLKQLKDKDITLHLLQKYDFAMSGNKSPKTTDLYGIDNKQVFTRTRSSDTRKNMFETIKLPSCDCAELALASNGSVFDANKMSRSDKSMFVNGFSQRIADSLEMVNCHRCQCGRNEMGMAQLICTRCPSIIEPYSPPFYLPGKFFQGNFQINENLKEQLNKYWDRFKKTSTKQKKTAAKNARSKGRR